MTDNPNVSEVVCALLASKEWRRIIKMIEDGCVSPDQEIVDLQSDESFELLAAAVEGGGNELALYLINRRANLNGRLHGWTPLMLACQTRNHEIVEALLVAGAEFGLKTGKEADGQGETALMQAARTHDLWAIRRLLQAGANAKDVTPRKETAILFAIHRKATDKLAEVIKELHACGCPLVGEELHVPIYRRDLQLVSLLLQLGCPTNVKFTHRVTMGPDKGETPLTAAVVANTLDEMARGVEQETLKGKKLQIVRSLLAAGSDPNLSNVRGRTPLMLAVVDGEPSLATILLEYGADPDFAPANSRYESPRRLATQKKLSDFILMFQKNVTG